MRMDRTSMAALVAAFLTTQACAAPADKVAAAESETAEVVSTPAAPVTPAANDPLLKPIAEDYAKQWLSPAPPTKVYGNAYLVGFGDLNVVLIRTDAGLILIDGAVPQAVRDIEKNIAALGFKVSDIKYILSTEPHYDHSGGLAALQRDSGGAPVLAGVDAVAELRSGIGDPKDPQGSTLEAFPAIPVVRGMRDGETITLGDVTVTAVSTPSHTLGSTSWSWQSCEGKACKKVVFAASPNPASSGDYQFSSAGGKIYADAFRRTFARLRSMPCDILITAHPSQSKGAEKLAALRAGQGSKAGTNPFVDPQACKSLATTFEKKLEDRLAKEGAQVK